MSDSLVFSHAPMIGTPNGLVNRRVYPSIRENCHMQYDGKKITSLREAKTWSMGELARRARISQPSLWALEHQVTKKPKAETLFALASALGVPVKALLSTRPSKLGVPTSDQLEAIFESLDDGNKQVLVAAAEAILRNQRK